jgi:RHH-type rel operon transcriptional repressor/antitoxin RelB
MGKVMATVNFRVDETLKEKSYSVLKEQGIAPTEFFTNILEYIATTGKLPVQKALLSEEDAELLTVVRKRINDPKEMFEEITLDDL